MARSPSSRCQDQFDHLDPQRNYTGEDLAFTGAYLIRTPDRVQAQHGRRRRPTRWSPTSPPTPARRPTDAKTWKFTLRDGATWEDGSPVTCEDVKYGVSRTFATDVITDGPPYAIAYLDIPKDKDGSLGLQGPVRHQGQRHGCLRQGRRCCDGKTITFNLAQAGAVTSTTP